MATTSSIDTELRDICDVLNEIDPKVGEILDQFGSVPRCDIEYELLECLEKSSLIKLREKIFEMVKEIAARRLCQKNAGNMFGDAVIVDPQDDPKTALSFVDQWEAVPRRVDKKFASDACDFLAFVLDHDPVLPLKLIRGVSLDNGNIEDEAEENEIEDQLEADIENAEGPIDIEVVETKDNSEVHLVTFPDTQEKGASDGDTDESSSESEAETNIVSKPENNKKDAGLPESEAAPVVCSVCKGNPRTKADSSTSTSDFAEYLRCLAAETGMDCDERPVTNGEFELHTDYIERLVNETIGRVKDLEDWRFTVEHPVPIEMFESWEGKANESRGPPTRTITIDDDSLDGTSAPISAHSQQQSPSVSLADFGQIKRPQGSYSSGDSRPGGRSSNAGRNSGQPESGGSRFQNCRTYDKVGKGKSGMIHNASNSSAPKNQRPVKMTAGPVYETQAPGSKKKVVDKPVGELRSTEYRERATRGSGASSKGYGSGSGAQQKWADEQCDMDSDYFNPQRGNYEKNRYGGGAEQQRGMPASRANTDVGQRQQAPPNYEKN